MNWLINFIATLFRQLRCDHKTQAHVRNIHGDEINYSGGMRSVWRCDDCGKSLLRPELKDGGYSHAQAMVEESVDAIRTYGFAGASWYGDGIFSPVTLKLLAEPGKPLMVESVLIGLNSDCGEFSFGELWDIPLCRLDSLDYEIEGSIAYAVWLRAALALGIERIPSGAFDEAKDQRYMDVWEYINAQARVLLEDCGGWRGDLRTVAEKTLKSTLIVFAKEPK